MQLGRRERLDEADLVFVQSNMFLFQTLKLCLSRRLAIHRKFHRSIPRDPHDPHNPKPTPVPHLTRHQHKHRWNEPPWRHVIGLS